MTLIYRIHRLPTSDQEHLAFLAGKFSSLRLSALAESPASFSSSFEIESKYTASQWMTRLSRPQVHTFIAVAYDASTSREEQIIERGSWIGHVCLLGPISRTKYSLSYDNGVLLAEDDAESKWQMIALYNSLQHRGKGVARMLVKAALDFTATAGGAMQSRVRIMIHPDNIVVKTLYDGIGFADAGLCTLAEAYTSSGDQDMLPADGGEGDPEHYLTRNGLVMEMVS